MEIEYKFDLVDYIEFQKNFIFNSKNFKRTKTITQLIGPVVFIFLILFEIHKNNFQLINMIILAVITVLWIYLSSKLLTKNTLKGAKKMMSRVDHSTIVGMHKLILNDDEITLIKPDSKQKVNWKEILKFEETDLHYFLYNTKNSAIVIPKYKVKDQLIELDKEIKLRIDTKK